TVGGVNGGMDGEGGGGCSDDDVLAMVVMWFGCGGDGWGESGGSGKVAGRKQVGDGVDRVDRSPGTREAAGWMLLQLIKVLRMIQHPCKHLSHRHLLLGDDVSGGVRRRLVMGRWYGDDDKGGGGCEGWPEAVKCGNEVEMCRS
nr:hypothetical protein [Tanacetum cinerariifolium]